MQPAQQPVSVEEEIASELTALALFFHKRGQHQKYLRVIALRDQLWDALDSQRALAPKTSQRH